MEEFVIEKHLLFLLLLCLFIPRNLGSLVPAETPTALPSSVPTALPSSVPSTLPQPNPTSLPSSIPSALPSFIPTVVISSSTPTISPPSGTPTIQLSRPSNAPTNSPTFLATFAPTVPLTLPPTSRPSAFPSLLPSLLPTIQPAPYPSMSPTPLPSGIPSSLPTFPPSPSPTVTGAPTQLPTLIPTALPSLIPTNAPTPIPTLIPTAAPTPFPSFNPTVAQLGGMDSTAIRHIVLTALCALVTSILAANFAPILGRGRLKIRFAGTIIDAATSISTTASKQDDIKTPLSVTRAADPLNLLFGLQSIAITARLSALPDFYVRDFAEAFALFNLRDIPWGLVILRHEEVEDYDDQTMVSNDEKEEEDSRDYKAAPLTARTWEHLDILILISIFIILLRLILVLIEHIHIAFHKTEDNSSINVGKSMHKNRQNLSENNRNGKMNSWVCAKYLTKRLPKCSVAIRYIKYSALSFPQCDTKVCVAIATGALDLALGASVQHPFSSNHGFKRPIFRIPFWVLVIVVLYIFATIALARLLMVSAKQFLMHFKWHDLPTIRPSPRRVEEIEKRLCQGIAGDVLVSLTDFLEEAKTMPLHFLPIPTSIDWAAELNRRQENGNDDDEEDDDEDDEDGREWKNFEMFISPKLSKKRSVHAAQENIVALFEAQVEANLELLFKRCSMEYQGTVYASAVPLRTLRSSLATRHMIFLDPSTTMSERWSALIFQPWHVTGVYERKREKSTIQELQQPKRPSLDPRKSVTFTESTVEFKAEQPVSQKHYDDVGNWADFWFVRLNPSHAISWYPRRVLGRTALELLVLHGLSEWPFIQALCIATLTAAHLFAIYKSPPFTLMADNRVELITSMARLAVSLSACISASADSEAGFRANDWAIWVQLLAVLHAICVHEPFAAISRCVEFTVFSLITTTFRSSISCENESITPNTDTTTINPAKKGSSELEESKTPTIVSNTSHIEEEKNKHRGEVLPHVNRHVDHKQQKYYRNGVARYFYPHQWFHGAIQKDEEQLNEEVRREIAVAEATHAAQMANAAAVVAADGQAAIAAIERSRKIAMEEKERQRGLVELRQLDSRKRALEGAASRKISDAHEVAAATRAHMRLAATTGKFGLQSLPQVQQKAYKEEKSKFAKTENHSAIEIQTSSNEKESKTTAQLLPHQRRMKLRQQQFQQQATSRDEEFIKMKDFNLTTKPAASSEKPKELNKMKARENKAENNGKEDNNGDIEKDLPLVMLPPLEFAGYDKQRERKRAKEHVQQETRLLELGFPFPAESHREPLSRSLSVDHIDAPGRGRGGKLPWMVAAERVGSEKDRYYGYYGNHQGLRRYNISGTLNVGQLAGEGRNDQHDIDYICKQINDDECSSTFSSEADDDLIEFAWLSVMLTECTDIPIHPLSHAEVRALGRVFLSPPKYKYMRPSSSDSDDMVLAASLMKTKINLRAEPSRRGPRCVRSAADFGRLSKRELEHLLAACEPPLRKRSALALRVAWSKLAVRRNGRGGSAWTTRNTAIPSYSRANDEVTLKGRERREVYTRGQTFIAISDARRRSAMLRAEATRRSEKEVKQRASRMQKMKHRAEYHDLVGDDQDSCRTMDRYSFSSQSSRYDDYSIERNKRWHDAAAEAKTRRIREENAVERAKCDEAAVAARHARKKRVAEEAAARAADPELLAINLKLAQEQAEYERAKAEAAMLLQKVVARPAFDSLMRDTEKTL